MRRPKIEAKSVLITGCSSGIGRATADLLRSNGWTVVPTARKQEDLDALRNDGYTPVSLDLSDPVSVQTASDEVLALLGGRLGALVNNAGYALMGAMEDINRDALRHQLEVNFIGVQDLITRFIPVLRRQGWGRIVNVSSVYGRVAAPLVGSYCASKFALEAATDALRIELRPTGVGVSLIEPGPIISEFRINAAAVAADKLDADSSRFSEIYARKITRNRDKQPKPDFFKKTPSAVAFKIRHALESGRPRRRYPVTPAAYLTTVMRRFAPDALLDRLLALKTQE